MEINALLSSKVILVNVVQFVVSAEKWLDQQKASSWQNTGQTSEAEILGRQW